MEESESEAADSAFQWDNPAGVNLLKVAVMVLVGNDTYFAWALMQGHGVGTCIYNAASWLHSILGAQECVVQHKSLGPMAVHAYDSPSACGCMCFGKHTVQQLANVLCCRRIAQALKAEPLKSF